jgi:hypothetical protein
MIALARVITSFEDELRARHRLLPSQHHALEAIKRCRTARSPRMQVECTACHQQQIVPHLCGHRSCPHCQHHESEQWLQCQLKRQVPTQYLLVTFTLPTQLRALAFDHQRVVYDALLRASWDTSARAFFNPRPGLMSSECGSAMKIIRTRLPPPRRMRDRPPDGMPACAVM